MAERLLLSWDRYQPGPPAIDEPVGDPVAIEIGGCRSGLDGYARLADREGLPSCIDVPNT